MTVHSPAAPTKAHSSAVSSDEAMLRRAMIDTQLRTNGVTDGALLRAIAATPRGDFVDAGQLAAAYADRAVPLGGGRGLNPVLTTARLLQAADMAGGENILLVGGASGYCAALLRAMGATVTMVECDGALAARAAKTLGDDANIITGPLADGAPQSAPFDRLVIDGAIESVPAALSDQLRPGGIAVMALRDGAVTRLARAVKSADVPLAPIAFAELEAANLPGFAPEPSFAF